jgi:hypothetical protein
MAKGLLPKAIDIRKKRGKTIQDKINEATGQKKTAGRRAPAKRKTVTRKRRA